MRGATVNAELFEECHLKQINKVGGIMNATRHFLHQYMKQDKLCVLLAETGSSFRATTLLDPLVAYFSVEHSTFKTTFPNSTKRSHCHHLTTSTERCTASREKRTRKAMSDAQAVAKAVVGKLGRLLSEEYRLLHGVRGSVAHLRDEVEIMNAVLRMLAEADESSIDHFIRAWTKQVRELAHDAEDCIDIFVRCVSIPGHAGGKAARVLHSAWHLLATLRARHRLASDIQGLHARAIVIGKRRTRYGIDGQAL